MSGLGTAIAALFAFIPCLWLALFTLTWRDARRKPIACALDPNREPKDVLRDVPNRLSQERGLRYWLLSGFLVALSGIDFFLVWPGFVGTWFGSRRKR
jgi:hypothetical protein